jgi:DNA-directed RNA polymerase subunit L
MSDFKVSIPYNADVMNPLTFEFKGDPKYGLDKTIVNGIRRILLSSMDSVAFRTTQENSDLKVVTNNSSLHNEFLLHRIGLIPLYIDPNFKDRGWHKDYLFQLKVENKTNQLKPISAENIDIYKVKASVLKKCVDSNDFSQMDNFDIENYNITEEGKLTPKQKEEISKQKEEIFKPFEYDYDGGKEKEYCLITELNTNKSEDNYQELYIYGSPSVSNCNEDVRWQVVSCATYSFKEDEDLFKAIKQEKIKVNNVPDDPKIREKFEKELYISEGERYFHRDVNLQPYWYNFKLETQGYFQPNKLLVKACDQIIEQFEGLKIEFKKMLDPDTASVMEIKKAKDSDLVYKIVMTGGDDTIGSILQAHICNKLIDEESLFNLCGYKKLHPLEEIITFTISLNTKNKIVKMDNIQKVNAIVDQMITGCNEISLIYQKINDEFKKI